MGYDSDEERKAHRFMMVFFIIVIMAFIGYKVIHNGDQQKQENVAEPTATVAVTEEAVTQ